jgi:hypothetical protein
VTFDNCLGNPDLRFTNGTYELIYRPISKQYTNSKEKPFVVRCDMLKGSKLRVKNYEGLKEIAKKDPVVAWILKWTTLNKDLFNVAKQHYFLPITFTIKYVEYRNHLQKLEPEARMLMSREEWMMGEEYRAERWASR